MCRLVGAASSRDFGVFLVVTGGCMVGGGVCLKASFMS